MSLLSCTSIHKIRELKEVPPNTEVFLRCLWLCGEKVSINKYITGMQK